jgi:hypothetical protein
MLRYDADMKMIPGPLRVPGTDPKTEFEAFDILATKLIRTPKPVRTKPNTAAKKKRAQPKRKSKK